MGAEMCTVVFAWDSSDYVRDVLGHGGCNTFPDSEGACSQCGLFIRANSAVAFHYCPRCGAPTDLEPGEGFSQWSYLKGGIMSHRCDYIQSAATHRQPAVLQRS